MLTPAGLSNTHRNTVARFCGNKQSYQKSNGLCCRARIFQSHGSGACPFALASSTSAIQVFTVLWFEQVPKAPNRLRHQIKRNFLLGGSQLQPPPWSTRKPKEKRAQDVPTLDPLPAEGHRVRPLCGDLLGMATSLPRMARTFDSTFLCHIGHNMELPNWWMPLWTQSCWWQLYQQALASGHHFPGVLQWVQAEGLPEEPLAYLAAWWRNNKISLLPQSLVPVHRSPLEENLGAKPLVATPLDSRRRWWSLQGTTCWGNGRWGI